MTSQELQLGHDAPFKDDGKHVHTHPLAVATIESLDDPLFSTDVITDPAELNATIARSLGLNQVGTA